MPLPIIIIFQRYFDAAPQTVVKDMLKPLAAQGYDTLCLELPHNLTMNEIESGTKKNLDFVEKLNADAVGLLKQRNITNFGELSSMGYSRLSELMMFFVSSRRYNEVAYNLKHLPAIRVQKELISTAKHQSMLVQGIDSENSSFDMLYNNGLSAVVKDIDKNLHDKNVIKAANLTKLYKQRKGIILTSGVANAPDIISALDKTGLHDNVLYYFLHSSTRLDDSLDDVVEAAKNIIFTNHTFLIDNQDDIAAFTKKLNEDIAARAPQIAAVMPQQQANSDSSSSQVGKFFQSLRSYVAPVGQSDGKAPAP